MAEFWATLSTAEQVYATCALAGGILFVIRTIMTLIGGFEHDVDAIDHPGDIGDHVSDVSGEADVSFRALSIQGITAFFMMFGLVGLALSKQSGAGDVISALGGTAAGIVTVWIIGKIFMSLQKLQSDGTLNYGNAIGQEGSVYLSIPESGKGQVSVAIQGQLRICNAVSADKSRISTGERVVVVDVTNGNTLVVTRAV